MVVEYIRYSIPQARREDFEQAYTRAQAQLRMSPECTGYELSRCVEDPSQYVLRITWTSADAHLKGFRGGEQFPPFLEQIRPFIDAIEEMRHYTPLSVRSDIPIHESAGGDAKFEALAHTMHGKMAVDPLLRSWFGHASASHVPHLTQWLIEVFGGPPAYSSEHGDIAPILEKHRGLDIPEAERARFEALAAASAAEVWPDRPDVVRAISRYVAWGTKVAVENSLPEHVADPGVGVPTWGWED